MRIIELPAPHPSSTAPRMTNGSTVDSTMPMMLPRMPWLASYRTFWAMNSFMSPTRVWNTPGQSGPVAR